MNLSRLSKIFQICTLILSCLAAALLAARMIDLSTADLGRHLANGKWVLQNHDVLYTNFYSDTHPHAPFVNHHWLSGLIFYGIHELTGFVGLSLSYVLLIGGALAVVSLTNWLEFKSWVVVSAAILSIPMVSYRTEVRPEGISFLLSAITYAIASAYARDRLRPRWLLTLPLIVVVWVNCHIYFFFGMIVIGAFAAEALLYSHFSQDLADRQQAKTKFKLLAWTLALCCIASLVNPEGWKLATYPFRIFNNYGYMIVENQGIPFFLRRGMHFPVFGPVYVALGVFCTVVAMIAIRRPAQIPYASLVITLLLAAMSVSAIRNIAMFGLFLVPTICQSFKALKPARWRSLLLATASGLAIVWFSITAGPQMLAGVGLGLQPGVLAAAEFFRTQNLKGPMFNNYDIGGYLIYSLFPDTKVFVDNRPEAYPAYFLTDVYIPAQEDNSKWRQLDSALHFNVIFFNWHDYTPAGQTFLISRINDPEWAPVFVDPYALIMVRRTAAHQDVISRFEIPKDRFSVKSTD